MWTTAAQADVVDLSKVGRVDEASVAEGVERLGMDLVRWVERDWLGIGIGVAFGVGLYLTLLFVRGFIRKKADRATDRSTWHWVVFRVLSRTRGYYLAMLSTKLVTVFSKTPPTWDNLISFFFMIAVVVQMAYWVRETLVSLLERRASQDGADPALASAVGVLTVIINVVVIFIAGIILLDNLGVNVTGLVAGLGIGGIAIGLAAQNTFSDLFSALSILLDRPFKVGETILIGGTGGVTGTVEHIGLKTTRMRASSGEMIIMSNSKLLDSQINNLSYFKHRSVSLLIDVIYQTDFAHLEQIPNILKEIVEAVPGNVFVRAHLTQFQASSLSYELAFETEATDLKSMYDARQTVMLKIIRRFAELGIEFAFPAQVSYVAGPDGRILHPSEALPEFQTARAD